jgi:hypothetical protein
MWGAIFASSPSCAENLTDEQAIEAAQEGLQKSARFPWYDAKQDNLRDVRAVELSTDDSKTRKEGWQATAKPTKTQKAAPGPALTTGGGAWGNWFSVSMQTLAIILFAVLIVTLIIIAVRYFLQEEELVLAGAGNAKLNVNEAEQNARRVENLPFQAPVQKGDHLSEAQRYYEAGDFGRAMVYLYAYQLMQLDRHQFIQLTKGKTNRQYLREINRDPLLRNIVELAMIGFEDVFFGNHPISREQFEASWQQVAEFHRRLESRTSVNSLSGGVFAKGVAP